MPFCSMTSCVRTHPTCLHVIRYAFATTTPCVSCQGSNAALGDVAGASCSPVGAPWDRAHSHCMPRHSATLRLLWGVRICDRLRLGASNFSRSVSPENKNL